MMKYIYGPATELYNLADDPREQHDLIASQKQVAAALREELRNFYGERP